MAITSQTPTGKYYSRHRYAAYALDFCGSSVHGKSTGKSTDMTITSGKEDLLAVFDYTKAMDNVDAENIVMSGGSQGGLVSVLAAAERAVDIYKNAEHRKMESEGHGFAMQRWDIAKDAVLYFLNKECQ